MCRNTLLAGRPPGPLSRFSPSHLGPESVVGSMPERRGGRLSRPMKIWVAAAIVALVGTQGAFVAWAATNTSSASDGGNTVKVGVGSATSQPGRGAVHRGVHRGSSSGTSSAPCTYIPLPAKDAETFGAGGPTPGAWFFVKCPGRDLTIYNGALSWFPSGPPPRPSTPAVAPSALALQAAASLTLPSPVVNLNPSAFSVVNLSSWLWIDPQAWHGFQATATAGGISATAVATPDTVSWSMGDGHTVVCGGPGTPYQPALPVDAQTTDCSYTYVNSSAGQPSTDGDTNDGAFSVTATISWTVSWSATGVVGGGSLPPLHTSSTVRVRVEQVESVGTAG